MAFEICKTLNDKEQEAYLLDYTGMKHTFYCIAANDYNGSSSFRSIGDFNAIENKRIVKYRIETIESVVDYNVDKSRAEAIATHYRFIKIGSREIFPNGVLDVKETIDILNS